MNTFPNHSNSALLELNRIYMREFRTDPTEGNRAAVIETSQELSRRGL